MDFLDFSNDPSLGYFILFLILFIPFAVFIIYKNHREYKRAKRELEWAESGLKVMRILLSFLKKQK